MGLGADGESGRVNGARPRFPVLDHPRPIAFAHRGGTERHPENTMAAFADAVALGYRYLETDVQVTRDGVAVAFHDARLDRLAGRPGAIGELTWRELRGLRVAGREPIPRLDELLHAWPELRVNLDPKSDAAVAPLAEAIRRTKALDRVCVGSFSGARLRRMRRLLGPRLCTSLAPLGVARLRLASLRGPAGRFVEGAVQVAPRHFGVRIVDARLLRAARRAGLQVHVWTVNREADMEALLDLGVDGLMTGRPRLLREVLRRRGQWA